uniref:MIT domain-containing protein n=1 Tax=Syphacia muris TaxID=451379 RepID=A0A0N5B143_9BILA
MSDIDNSTNDINGMPPAKVIVDVYKQLISGFHPDLHKSADAYIKAIEVLAKTGEKGFSEGKRKAAELEIKKFSDLLTKLSENCRDEKEELKERSHNYESKEKNLKKAVYKGQEASVLRRL